MGERDLGPFSPAPGTYPGRAGSKNGYLYGKNQTYMAGLHQARLSYLESVQCAISHPNAWESMTLGHFGPFQAPIQGSKNGYFYGKNQTNMAGLHQARLSYL